MTTGFSPWSITLGKYNNCWLLPSLCPRILPLPSQLCPASWGCLAGSFLCICSSKLPAESGQQEAALAVGWIGDCRVLLPHSLTSHGPSDSCCILSMALHPAGWASPSGKSRAGILATLPSLTSWSNYFSVSALLTFWGHLSLCCPWVISLLSCLNSQLFFQLYNQSPTLNPLCLNAEVICDYEKNCITESCLDSQKCLLMHICNSWHLSASFPFTPLLFFSDFLRWTQAYKWSIIPLLQYMN